MCITTGSQLKQIKSDEAEQKPIFPVIQENTDVTGLRGRENLKQAI